MCRGLGQGCAGGPGAAPAPPRPAGKPRFSRSDSHPWPWLCLVLTACDDWCTAQRRPFLRWRGWCCRLPGPRRRPTRSPGWWCPDRPEGPDDRGADPRHGVHRHQRPRAVPVLQDPARDRRPAVAGAGVPAGVGHLADRRPGPGPDQRGPDGTFPREAGAEAEAGPALGATGLTGKRLWPHALGPRGRRRAQLGRGRAAGGPGAAASRPDVRRSHARADPGPRDDADRDAGRQGPGGGAVHPARRPDARHGRHQRRARARCPGAGPGGSDPAVQQDQARSCSCSLLSLGTEAHERSCPCWSMATRRAPSCRTRRSWRPSPPGC